MAWQIFDNFTGAGLARYGKVWIEYPCISVTAGGVSFNSLAINTFEIDKNDKLCIMFDSENNKFAFKKVNGELRLRNQCFGLIKQRNASILCVRSKQISETLSNFIGRAYKLELNSEEKIVEAILT